MSGPPEEQNDGGGGGGFLLLSVPTSTVVVMLTMSSFGARANGKCAAFEAFEGSVGDRLHFVTFITAHAPQHAHAHRTQDKSVYNLFRVQKTT